jgi:predicted dinucleotide-binding enzyme
MTVVSNTGYHNGASDGAIGGALSASTQPVYIGCRNNNGVADLFCTAKIQAILICDNSAAFAAADIVAIAASPGGSMWNL